MSQPAYRLFNVELKRREQLSPALTRFVFGGPEVAEMKTLAADQRIKIFFPDASGQPPSLPGGSEWYQAYRSVEPARRPPMRTYHPCAARRAGGGRRGVRPPRRERPGLGLGDPRADRRPPATGRAQPAIRR